MKAGTVPTADPKTAIGVVAGQGLVENRVAPEHVNLHGVVVDCLEAVGVVAALQPRPEGSAYLLVNEAAERINYRRRAEQ